MPGPDPRPEPRIVDRNALRVARLAGDACVACGRNPGSVHHVIPRSERGDDVAANLLLLCGSGTTGCHGAWHGNPYVVNGERRDAAWVARRIGLYVRRSRPDTVLYLQQKLGGEEAALAYLERRYYWDLPGDSASRISSGIAPDS